MKQFQRLLAVLISLCIALDLLGAVIPVAQAAASSSAGAQHAEAGSWIAGADAGSSTDSPEISDRLGAYTVTHRRESAAAPGLTETELIVNSGTGLAQNRIHILELDPAEGSLSLAAGYRDYDASCWGLQRPSDQVAAAEAALRAHDPEVRVVGAVNANFYNMLTGEPLGALVMNGSLVHPSEEGFAYLALLEDGRAEIREAAVPIGPEVREAVAGREILVRDGIALESADTDRNPRTAVGIRADGSILLWQSEGRLKPLSEGLTVNELAQMLVDLGCVEALNLDGGGSSVLLSARGQAEGLCLRSQPSDGCERHVSSTLLVVSTSTEAVVQPEPHDHDWRLAEDGETAVCGCGAALPLTSLTGILTDGAGDRYCYLAGARKSGWVTWGREMLHSNSDGRLHAVTTTDGRTCTADGKLSAICDTCKRSYSGYSLYRTGHRWNEDHVCTVCGAVGIDVAACSVTNVSAAYSYRTEGQRIAPTPILTHGDHTLSLKNSSFGEDGFLLWQCCDRIGRAQVVVEGQGDYYGRLIIPYSIVPNKVPEAVCSEAGAEHAVLTWSGVSGVDSYVVCRWDAVGKTLIPMTKTDAAARSVTLLGLEPDTDWTLCILGRRTVDGVDYDSRSYSWIQFRTPKAEEDPNGSASLLQEIRCPLPGVDPIRDQTDRYGRRCLFLPAFADPGALPLELLLTEAAAGPVRLTGSRSGTEVGSSCTLDLNALCWPEADGGWRLELQIGDLTPMQLRVYRASVPALFLRSEDPENRGREWVDASKSNESAGTAALIRPDGSVVYDGALTQLKARGNTTFRYAPKKSYQIKIKKTDLIGIGEKVKTWVLLGGYTDATQLHDRLLKDLAADLGMAFVPREDWVDLYYDGEYRGLYLLGEKNSVGSTGVDVTDLEAAYEAENPDYGASPQFVRGENRFGNEVRWTEGLTDPADLTGGYLLELNHSRYDEVNGFITSQGKGVNLKSPEYLSRAAVCYISEYYQEFEDAVCNPDHSGVNPDTGKHYYEYVDRDSLVRIWLIQELANNVDGFISSFYFYKDAGGLMYAGPVWDLDSTLGTGWAARISPELNFISAAQNGRYLARDLIQIPDFAAAVRACYLDAFRSLAAELPGEDGRIAAHSGRILASAVMNYRLWPYVRFGDPAREGHVWEGADYAFVLADLDAWITRRLEVLDDRLIRGIPSDEPVDPPLPPLQFEDVQDESRFYFAAVYWAAGRDPAITNGITETRFGPDLSCTRAQVVTFLWRAAGCPEPTGTQVPFSDVKPEAFYTKAMLWALENGVTTGLSPDRFGPNEVCTRAQVVTFLWRAFGCPEPAQSQVPFDDVKPDAFYYRAMLWALEHGVTTGLSPQRFGPGGVCTRAQVVTFLWRAFEPSRE